MTSAESDSAAQSGQSKIEKPVFIVSTPRSGSTLLFETLVKAPDLYSAGNESHARIEQVADLFPGRRGWTSNRLTAEDAIQSTVKALSAAFYPALRDRAGAPPSGGVRMLEKTPKNALRVPFFDAAWPDSYFVYLYRDPRQTLGSMIEAWLSGRFVTYPMLPGWGRPPWSLLLVPGWRDLVGKPLPEVVAIQWATTTKLLIQDLQRLPRERVLGIDYAQLLADPQATMIRLARALDLRWDVELPDALPLSKTTFTRPSKDKWRRFEAEIEKVYPALAEADLHAQALLDEIRC